MADNSVKSKLVPQYKKNARIMRGIGLCLCICLVFCAGFWARGNEVLMGLLGISDPSVQQTNSALSSASTFDSLAARVSEVEDILDKDSLDEYDLGTATELVMNSYISSTNDSYLHYYDEPSYNTYLANTSNPESGVGILFGEKDGTCYAADVFDGSEAAALGVKPGDFVDAIDGVHKDVWTMAEVVNTLGNRQGEDVIITWRRDSNSGDATTYNTFTTTLEYRDASTDNITFEVTDGVAFIDVKQLSADSAKVMRETIQASLQQGARAFVIDLRDVPGGYLTQAVEIASFFIQSGTVVQIQTNVNTTTRSADGEPLTKVPVVVLVNENTAGAAEVLAAALQEVNKAPVVGTVTQGKGSVQVMQPLSFGGALRYTAAVYLTPSGRSLDGSGVSPDVMVRNGQDQSITAIEIARSRAS